MNRRLFGDPSIPRFARGDRIRLASGLGPTYVVTEVRDGLYFVDPPDGDGFTDVEFADGRYGYVLV